MKRAYVALAMLLVLATMGCSARNEQFDPSPQNHPLEGVLKDIKFNLGGDTNNCRVEFADGRVICFDNGEGYLFHLGKVNRIHRRSDGYIEAVEIVNGPR